MVFKVTEEAKKELINTLETRKNTAMNFRVFVRGIGWGGPVFGIALDEQKENDYTEDFGNGKLMVEKDLKDQFKTFEIDFMKNFFSKGFVVRSQYGGSRC